MNKINGKKILIFIIVVFTVLNISWFLIINIRYNRFEKVIPKNRAGKHAMRTEDGYNYSVKKPDYLQYTGNLAVSNIDTGELLIIWPLIFGGYEYGFRLQEDSAVYEIYVDENMEPIDKGDIDTVEKIQKHKASMDKIFSNANELWELKKQAQSFASNITKDLTGKTPYIQPAPKNFKKVDENAPLPVNLTAYNGSIEEVKDFVKKSLTDSVVIPPELKAEYTNSSVGTPQFVKNLKTKHSATERADDYYIVPFTENNQIVGACTVTIYDAQLTLGSISRHGLIKYSVFNKDINPIRDKVEKDNGVKVNNIQLVYKPDVSGKLCLNTLDPMTEFTDSNGKKYYYSNRDTIINQDKFQSLDTTQGTNLWGN